MAEIITFTNQKGGVGKTSLAYNFAVRLKMAGARVLLVDMDPQCSLTYIANVDNPKKTVYDVLLNRASAEEAVISADECEIIASAPELIALDVNLNVPHKELLLKNALDKIKDKYNFIIIDSPPTLGLLTINILSAATGVIIPALADVFSLQGVGQLYSTIETVRKHCNPNLKIIGIVLSRHSDRLKLSREFKGMMSETAQMIGTKVFSSSIREAVAVREAEAMRKSIFSYAGRSKQAMDYNDLVVEFLDGAGYQKI